MKSIQNQYNQLIEGNISQANFMRNVRMTFPHLVSNVTNFEDSVKILRNKGLLSEAKTDEGHLCNPVEVDLGLKVEVAKHEGDVEKAKKTVYANLKKNSSYYSQLNLGGQAVEPEKIKVKKSKKKHSDIDTENGMKKVKEIVKENLDEVGLNMMGDEQPNAAVKQAAQLIDLNNQLKPFSGEITLQNGMDNRAILKYGYWESLPEGVLEKLALQFDIETDVEDHGNEKLPTVAYILSPKASQINRNVDLGSAFEKFKASLEEIVREVIEEENQLNEGYYDDIAGYTSVSDNGTGFKDNDKVKSKSGQEGFVYDVLKSEDGKALVVVKFQRNGMTTISKYGEGFNDINDISK